MDLSFEHAKFFIFYYVYERLILDYANSWIIFLRDYKLNTSLYSSIKGLGLIVLSWYSALNDKKF